MVQNATGAAYHVRRSRGRGKISGLGVSVRPPIAKFIGLGKRKRVLEVERRKESVILVYVLDN
jgi:hypothetical protein